MDYVTITQQKMLTPKNVARILGMSLSQVYRLLKEVQDPIPHFRLNSSYRIPENKFDEWLQKHWSG